MGKNARKRFRLRLNQKIVLVFVGLILVVYLTGFVISIFLQQELLQRSQNVIRLRVQHVAGEIHEGIEKLQLMQYQAIDDYNLRRLAMIHEIEDMGKTMPLLVRCRLWMNTIQNSSVYAEAVSLYLPKLNRVLGYDVFYREPHPAELTLLASYFADPDKPAVYIYQDGSYLIRPVSPYYVLEQNHSIAESVVIKLNLDSIKTRLQDMTLQTEAAAYLVTDSQLMVASGAADPDFVTLFQNMKPPSDPVSWPKGQSFDQTARIGGRNYWFLAEPVESLGMSLLFVVPTETLIIQARFYQAWTIILTVIAIISLLIFIMIINRMINQPMRRFVQVFEALEHDNLISITYPAGDELDALFNAFNKMIDRLKHAIDQVYRSKISSQQAELKQLQSQINPHFLYNSFFHIYRMAKMDDLEGITEMSMRLSSYYQFITRSGSEFETLQREYQHAGNYVDIQSVRFGNRIEVDFAELPADCRDILVPRIILQPVIENAYVHGLAHLTEGGKIRVQARRKWDTLIITIEDNGDRLSKEVLADLQKKLIKAEKVKETTALINVNRRLQIHGGIGGGIRISRSSLGGLKVMMIMHIKEDAHVPVAGR